MNLDFSTSKRIEATKPGMQHTRMNAPKARFSAPLMKTSCAESMTVDCATGNGTSGPTALKRWVNWYRAFPSHIGPCGINRWTRELSRGVLKGFQVVKEQ